MAKSGHLLKDLEVMWAKMKAEAEEAGVDIGDLEWDGVEPYQLPDKLDGPHMAHPCRFCGVSIRWGTTHKGKKAPFDDVPPHANHWSTCSQRTKAREAFPKR